MARKPRHPIATMPFMLWNDWPCAGLAPIHSRATANAKRLARIKPVK